MRYQFYREHKYVSAALNDLERAIARADFRLDQEVQEILVQFKSLKEMLLGHAQYENEKLHTLLQNRQSSVYILAQHDHDSQEKYLDQLEGYMESILQEQTEESRLQKGYALYLDYRKFVADNLEHLHEEETVILPELQRLYSDQELQQVEAQTYQLMSAEEIADMIEVLFPHMNPSDQEAFLLDIQRGQPQKLALILKRIAPFIRGVEAEKWELKES